MKVKINSVYAGRTKILSEFDVNIKPGTTCAVVGPNGAGKSTLLNALTKHPTLKTDLFIEQLEDPIFLAFQKPPAIEELTYIQLLLIIERLYNSSSKTKEEYVDKYSSTISTLGLTDKMLNTLVGTTLSGGELKKMELLQLITMQPKTVMLDEIDTGMDIDTRIITGTIINDYLNKSKATALIVSHSLDYFEYFDVDKVLLMKNGVGKLYSKSVIKQIKQEGFKSF